MHIIIPVHSFVDIITNSSSEIYISATDNTVAAVREVVNLLLKAAGSTKTSTDLFNVRLSYMVRSEATDYAWKHFATKEERNEWIVSQAEKNDFVDSEVEALVVTAKDQANADASAAAKRLQELFYTLETNNVGGC